MFIMLLGSRILFGLFFPALASSGRAHLTGMTVSQERRGRLTAMGAASGSGFLIGPAMGAALSGVHLVFPVVVSAILLIVAVILVKSRIPNMTSKSVGDPLKITIRKPGLRAYFAIAIGLMCAIGMIHATAGFYIQDKFSLDAKNTAFWLGIALFCCGFAAALVQFSIIGRRSFHPRTLLRIGIPLLGAGMLMCLTVNYLPGIVCSFVLLGAGGGFAISGYTTGIILAVGEENHRGAARLAAAVTGLGFFAAPIVGTSLYRLQPEVPIWTGILIVLVLLAFVWSFQRELDLRKSSSSSPVI